MQMDKENKVREPLLLVLFTIIILYLVSFIPINTEIGGVQLRHLDIFSDLKDDSLDEPMNQNNTMPADEVYTNKVNEASFAMLGELGGMFNNFINTEIDKLNYSMPGNYVQTEEEPLSGDVSQMKYFFDALKNSKTGIVRVAHYGDSAIEGDLITADLREALQKKFGGNGVGYLGITSQDITFRTTTKQSFSDNWESAALYSSNPKNLDLGISGEAFVPGANAWAEFEVQKTQYRYLKEFTLVRVFYSDAKSSSINYSLDGGAAQSAKLNTGSGVQELLIKVPGGAKKIRLTFPMASQAIFYGISLENGNGVYVDNLPLRGNTGVDLQHISSQKLKDFSKILDYKLIILEFGLNIAGSRDYSWYEKEMSKVIQHYKEAFPKASILMISTHDKAMKKGSSFVTDPSILKLLAAQKKIAAENKVAIWSLFDAMGGQNSMPKWVEANPPLASRDYTHFNNQGAQKVAGLLSDAIIGAYNKSK